MSNEAQPQQTATANQNMSIKGHFPSEEVSINNLQRDLKDFLQAMAQKEANINNLQQDLKIFLNLMAQKDVCNENKFINIDEIEAKGVHHFSKLEKYMMLLHNLIELTNDCSRQNLWNMGQNLSHELLQAILQHIVKDKLSQSSDAEAMAKTARQQFCDHIKQYLNDPEHNADSGQSEKNQFDPQLDTDTLEAISHLLKHYHNAINAINIGNLLDKIAGSWTYPALSLMAQVGSINLPKRQEFRERVIALHGIMAAVMEDISNEIDQHLQQAQDNSNDPQPNGDKHQPKPVNASNQQTTERSEPTNQSQSCSSSNDQISDDESENGHSSEWAEHEAAGDDNLQVKIDQLNDQITSFNKQCQHCQQQLQSIDDHMSSYLTQLNDIKDNALAIIDAGKFSKNKKSRTNKALDNIKELVKELANNGENAATQIDKIQKRYNTPWTKRSDNHSRLLRLLGSVLDINQPPLSDLTTNVSQENQIQQLLNQKIETVKQQKAAQEDTVREQTDREQNRAYEQYLQPALEKLKRSINAYTDQIELGKAYMACHNRAIREVRDSKYCEQISALRSKLRQAGQARKDHDEQKQQLEFLRHQAKKVSSQLTRQPIKTKTPCPMTTDNANHRAQSPSPQEQSNNDETKANSSKNFDQNLNDKRTNNADGVANHNQRHQSAANNNQTLSTQQQSSSILSTVIDVISAPFKFVLGILNGLRYGLFKHDRDDRNHEVSQKENYSGFIGRYQYGFFQIWNDTKPSPGSVATPNNC